MKLKLTFIVSFYFVFLNGCALLQGSNSCPIGYNRAKAGNCVEDTSCLETEKCRTAGKCTYAPDDMCVATRPIDCRQSENCRHLGECEFRRTGRDDSPVGLCVANESGCAAAEVCAEFGKCTPGRGDFCVVGDDADCQKSSVCRNEKRCTARRMERADGKNSRILSCQQ